MKKYDKIRRLNYDNDSSFEPNEIVIVQEKIDGANFRCWRNENNKIEFGSKNIEFGLQTENYDRYQKSVDYILENEEIIIKGYVYFFEAMIKHSVTYDDDKPCYLIDIYDLTRETYMSHITYRNKKLNKVKIIFDGNFSDYKFEPNLITNYNTLISKEIMEGVVIKSITNLNKRAKIVNDIYKEENSRKFIKNNNVGKEVVFIEKFVTQARINKSIFKIQDRLPLNKKVDIKFISAIIDNVLYDIIVEEFKKFLKIGNNIDIKLLKIEIGNKVRNVLLDNK